jgi:hypothetical protein
MNAIRITFTALVLAAAGFAQASEITEFTLEKSVKSRADVQAEARGVRAAPGELYDGSHLMATTAAPASTKSRDEVRMAAHGALGKVDAVTRNDLVGGM